MAPDDAWPTDQHTSPSVVSPRSMLSPGMRMSIAMVDASFVVGWGAVDVRPAVDMMRRGCDSEGQAARCARATATLRLRFALLRIALRRSRSAISHGSHG